MFHLNLLILFIFSFLLLFESKNGIDVPREERDCPSIHFLFDEVSNFKLHAVNTVILLSRFCFFPFCSTCLLHDHKDARFFFYYYYYYYYGADFYSILFLSISIHFCFVKISQPHALLLYKKTTTTAAYEHIKYLCTILTMSILLL